MTTTLIVLAMYVVIHVLSYLGKEAAKRKEKERQREAVQRRQGESGRITPPAPAPAGPSNIEAGFGAAGPVGARASPQPPRRTGKPVDDLAARRREQLDQLRQRREGKRAVSTNPGTPVSTPTVSRIPGLKNIEPTRDEMRARQMELERRRRAELEGSRLKQQRAVQQQREAEAAKERREQALGSVLQASLQADRPLTRVQTATDPFAAASLLRSNVATQLHNRATLRQFFVMRELLDRPLSLREAGQ